MSEDNSGGITFLGLLQILFIGLKLTNYIDWSWWFVLMPIIAVISVTLFLLFILWVSE